MALRSASTGRSGLVSRISPLVVVFTLLTAIVGFFCMLPSDGLGHAMDLDTVARVEEAEALAAEDAEARATRLQPPLSLHVIKILIHNAA